MPNYQLSKIYKIVPLNSEDDSDIYIGSTTKNTLAERMAEHRSKYRHWLEGISKVSSFRLFDKYGLENCYIFLIEEYPCNTKDELRAREGHFIITTPCMALAPLIRGVCNTLGTLPIISIPTKIIRITR